MFPFRLGFFTLSFQQINCATLSNTFFMLVWIVDCGCEGDLWCLSEDCSTITGEQTEEAFMLGTVTTTWRRGWVCV